MTTVEELDILVSRVAKSPEFAGVIGAKNKELLDGECSIGIQFPPLFKEWLQFCNGALIGPGGIFGVSCQPPELDLVEHWNRIELWSRNEVIPVAGDGCGNYYGIPLNERFGLQEPVVFFEFSDRDNWSSHYVVASNMLTFVRFLLLKDLRQINWPFSQETVSQDDPDILKAHGVTFPWTSAWT